MPNHAMKYKSKLLRQDYHLHMMILNYVLITALANGINLNMVIGERGKSTPRPSFVRHFLNRLELTGRFRDFINMFGLKNDLYLVTLPPPGKSKWRPQSRDCVWFSKLTTYKLHISASIADNPSNTIIVTATSLPFSESSNSMVLWTIEPDIKGVQKFKTVASEPEVRISHLVDEIKSQFQGLTPHFWTMERSTI